MEILEIFVDWCIKMLENDAAVDGCYAITVHVRKYNFKEAYIITTYLIICISAQLSRLGLFCLPNPSVVCSGKAGAGVV